MSSHRRGIFVTGTGTGVGKTAVSAGLAWAMSKRGIDVGVMKPFATADRPFSARYRSQDAATLALAAGVKGEGDSASGSDYEINPFFYPAAASPYMAARIKGMQEPDLEKAADALESIMQRHQFTIVEGIGGIMVPLTEREFVADFAARAGLPVLVVTLPALGTLNHTVLTVRACRQYNLDVAGIVVNMMPAKRPGIVERMTPEALERLTGVEVVAVVPSEKRRKGVAATSAYFTSYATAIYKKAGSVLEKSGAVDKVLKLLPSHP